MSNAADRKKIVQDAVIRTHTRRRIIDKVITGMTIACVAAALIPLGSILLEVAKNGASAIIATVTEFAVTLEGSQTSATGTGTFRYDDSNHELSFNIEFSGLSSSETTAQILGPAAFGDEPHVLFTLPAGSQKEGSADLDRSSLSRVDAEKDLFAGSWYVNINSENYPDGEIRGQILPTGKSSNYFNSGFLTQPQGSIVSGDGGIGSAIQGTLIVVGLASLIAVPVGVLGGIYLSEYAGTGKFPYIVRFMNNVMTGLPSIVVGIVGYIILVVTLGSFNVMAGAIALSIIMIPIVLGVTEETLKLVPNSVREAGHSLGIPKWRVTLSITLTSAKSGVLTGIVLGISRIAGETAPLIMTILGTSLFFGGFFGPVDGLPLRIWRLASQPYPASHEFAWGGALVLILMILSLSVALRYFVLEKRLRLRLPPLSLNYSFPTFPGLHKKNGGSGE
ncbi:MAG TPA: phosphate ABC transporter permease PstA [Nitrososphaera sp.]|nr:phosphate ABC transporter permease PstA [Nitrososphaera sp.]